MLSCGNPHPLPNFPGEPDWPASTFGGQVRVLPTLETYVMAGVHQVNPLFGGRSGWSWFRTGTTGVSVPLEVGYVPRFGADSLVGHYKLGYDYDSSRYPDLLQDGNGQPYVLSGNAARSGKSRNMFYVLVDQMLLRTGKTDTDGLILLGGYVHADRNISALSDQLFGGVLSAANFLGRPQDSLGAIFHYVRTSGRLTATQELQAASEQQLTSGGFGPVYGIQAHEEVVELQYTAHVYRGVTFEPDF